MKTVQVAVVALVACGASAFAGTSPAAAPAGHQASDEAAVLAAMDLYLAAVSANDLAAMAALQLPDGMTYRARAVPDGTLEVVGRPNRYWVDPARKDARTFRERYWSPTVLVRGGIATLWAPYEFWIDGKTSHCGIDVFDFVKKDGAWLVANAMWTVEPEGCAELRPKAGVEIRPKD
jgi:hypothetical protein